MDNIIGERLRKLRKDADLTGAKLGKVLGCTKTNISYWEKGKVAINPKMLVQIAKFFNVTTDYLVGLSNIPNTTYRGELSANDIITSKQYTRIPIYEEIAEDLADSKILNFFFMNKKEIENKSCFGWILNDDDMINDYFSKGSTLIFGKQKYAESGDYVLVKFKYNSKPLFRKIRNLENGILFDSYNNPKSAVFISHGEEFIIIGKLISMFKFV